MCGIFGQYLNNSCDYNDEMFHESFNSLYKRGPDDFGLINYSINNGLLSLAHRRLSIIDLSDGGHQPMISPNGRFTITYNGEIYNYLELKKELISKGYQFKYKSDTEVLLNCWVEWGIKCLDHLEGMFAFCIYDKYLQKLFCIRDPYGIKPLYYFRDKKKFIFSSDINSIQKSLIKKANYCKNSISRYLLMGHFLDDTYETFLDSILRVKPGEYLEINLKDEEYKIITKTWYSIDIKENKNIKFKEAVEELRFIFLDSIKKQIRSDVKIGFSLSGGIDSSSIACGMRYLYPKEEINTYSYIPKDKKVSEEKYIDFVNSSINAKSNKVYFAENNLNDVIDEFIESQTLPNTGLSFLAEFLIYKKAKKDGIKVMLDGHGADEILGGYDGYPEYMVKSFLEKGEFINSLKFLKNWNKWQGRQKRKAFFKFFKGLFLSRMDDDFVNMLILELKIKSPFYQKILKSDFKLERNLPQNKEENIKGRALAQELKRNISRASCPRQLRGADTSAMWHSIENRVPFLSTPLVNFMLKLPEEFHISNKGKTKFLFRESMKGIVPDEILERKDKIGYEPGRNLSIILDSKLKRKIKDNIYKFDFLNSSFCEEILFNNRRNLIEFDPLKWRLFNLFKWSEFYK